MPRGTALVDVRLDCTFPAPIQSPEARAAIATGHFLLLRDGRILLSRVPTKFRFINHAPEPNAYIEFTAHRVLARREISAGEEITLDYRLEYTDPEFNRYARSLGCWLPDSLAYD